MFNIGLDVDRVALAAVKTAAVPDEVELETGVAQIAVACDLVADAEVAKFRLTCGGSKPWPVDVRTDLSVLLEQCPNIFRALAEREPGFQLRMYEQGIETVLSFARGAEVLTVIGRPLVPGGTSRYASDQAEEVSVEMFLRCITDVVAGFVECCAVVCPHLLAMPEFVEWKSAIGRWERADRSGAPG